MKYGLIGKTLGHSFSEIIHKEIGLYHYGLREIAECDLDAFLKEKDFCGINVTIPYKQRVIPYLDYIDPSAEKIGAVNTVVNRGGKLCGYNTDRTGLEKLILRVCPDINGKKCVVAGTGGTSKTAVAVLENLGASSVLTIGRGGKGDADYSETEKYRDADFIVNTTPVGMFPDNEGRVLDLSVFGHLRGVVDVVYNPLRTNLVLDGEKLGIPAEGGLYMLVAQAVAAAELFTDSASDDRLTEAIFKSLRFRMENTVLAGMPSCGKTTVGKSLAKHLGREFFDTDVLLEKKFGCSVKEYFAENGEEAFRDRETELIRNELVNIHGAVIATGGGIVLRGDNVRMLKQNGRIVFIDRPLKYLSASASRPLSSDKAALDKLYNDRYPIYVNVSDLRIEADAAVDENVIKIAEAIK